MSSNDEEKTEAKSYPLDLAAKIGVSKPSADGKTTATPLLIPGGAPLRSFRIMSQPPAVAASTGGATIITNLVPQGTIIKQGDATRHITGIINTQVQPQVSGNILQRQITFPVVAQNSHVPRGASVVANLSAPRSNVAGAIRGPLVVTASATGPATNLVRNARAPSPAQAGTAWISTSGANGSQVKGVSTVLSAGRATTIAAGKPAAVVAKPQVGQIVSTIKPNTTILQSAIIGQNQIHQFKNTVPGIQTLSTTVTLAQVVPARTQTLVYSTGATGFAPTPRITVAPNVQRGQTSATTRPLAQVAATRLAVPVTVGTTRILAPQGAVLTPAARIAAVPASQPTALPTRIISTQANVALGRLTVAVTNAPANAVNPILTPMRPTLVVPTSSVQNRGVQGAKVIAQGTQAIHLTMPATGIKTSAISTPRTLSSQTTITQRPAAVVSSHAMSIAKVYPNQEGPAASLYLQTPAQHNSARRTSPGPPAQAQSTPATSATKYPFYDDAGGNRFPRAFGQASGTTIACTSQAPPAQRSAPNSNAAAGNQANRFNPVTSAGDRPYAQENSDAQNVQTKITSSPRPSILRKREHDGGAPLKAAKNLMSSLANLQPPLSPPSRPDSRNNGHSSGGSTTISATSSPGLADANEDSNQHAPMNKEEEENRPPVEVSPRKKPRKQNLAGNDMEEHDDDMQFISERDLKREHDESDGMNSEGPQDGAPESRHGVASVRKPASASLLNYMQRWKTTNNHYQRYSDVRPKDERRPTIIEMANQHRVLDKINGWKIHHLSTQMEDLAEEEHTVHSQLADILKFTDKQDLSNPDINRITELIKGNMQRVKIIKDGMVEANAAIMKIFDHKVHVTDIINRCASKRNYKKREKT